MTAPFRIQLPVSSVLGLLAFMALVLGAPLAVASPPQVPGVRLVEAFPGVTFESPVGILYCPDGSDTLYVLEQGGRAKAIEKWRGTGPVPQPRVFLDISNRVFPRLQGGLLGMAFHPQYAQNGRVFVTYVTGSQQQGFQFVVSEFQAKGGVCDAAREKPLLRIPKTLALHNGGWLAFGPLDGMLYVSTGDNAKQKEALQTSQNPASLLGKILRIDVNAQSPGLAYGIPADNPWAHVQQGVRREIYAYGMRNPWRFCFDAQGRLWTGEPGAKGEGTHEWIMKVQKGGNHGWPFFEGTRPLEPIPANLQNTSFVRPVFEYVRGPDPDLTAAYGGYFYRGNRVPALRGQYLFGDYPRASVYVIDVSTGKGTNHRTVANLPGVCAFGEDAQGELYFVSLDQGKIFTMVPQ